MARAQSPGDLRDYFQEFEDIRSSKRHDEDDEDGAKTPDEGEQEAEWLQEAGYGFIVSKYQAGKEFSEDEINKFTESMPSNHAAVVKRRVDTLNATLRKKQKYTTKIDVRNIFPEQLPGGRTVIHSQPLEGEEEGTRQLARRPATLPRGIKFGSYNGDSSLWTRQISPRSPTTNKYINHIIIETPKSPISPRSETVHPEWSRNKGGKGSFMKNKGGYSMSGMSEEVHDNVQQGVEMLSLQQKGTVQKRWSQLSPISDTDITFDFKLEENGGDLSPHGNNTVMSQVNAFDLPNFTLVPDKLGLTCIDDISEMDVTYVRNNALLELTSMYDTHNINYSRRRTKKRHKEHGIFGVPLVTLLEQDQKLKPNARIPLVFQEIVSYLVKFCLDTEGILRVPGSTSRIKQLRQEFEERFYQGTFIWGDDLTPNDVAALLKQFLRDLPVPLLTDEYIEAFAQVENLPDKKQQLHALNLLILLLPTVHRDTLNVLLEFLERVIEQKDTNKMSLNNVAMIMAPNLFMAPKVRGSNPAKNKAVWDIEIKMAANTSNIMKMLIRYRGILWTVPTYLMSLVRRTYELETLRKNKDNKSKMKGLLSKKDKSEVYKKPALKHEADFQDGVIRIQAPNLTKSSTALQLDNNMTAGDVVAKFKVIQGSANAGNENSDVGKTQHGPIYNDPRNYQSAGDDTFLFEVGGNIGERCLPHNTNMLTLYKVNPNAEWIIKRRERFKIT
ncbi:rho GTPase-activating protein 18-like isoform X4 [Ruditapes philippinarum]|uniref:rho GTPase-activating protein 18-like isoform X4 n=1 Tax=Ruditapes philippinarum TaxID=129788 RepID=UPI00295C0CEA|nr:rho GTPase-activating protein 18-like isoform X4 [Ruditapes philippinarum]